MQFVHENNEHLVSEIRLNEFKFNYSNRVFNLVQFILQAVIRNDEKDVKNFQKEICKSFLNCLDYRATFYVEKDDYLYGISTNNNNVSIESDTDFVQSEYIDTYVSLLEENDITRCFKNISIVQSHDEEEEGEVHLYIPIHKNNLCIGVLEVLLDSCESEYFLNENTLPYIISTIYYLYTCKCHFSLSL